MSAVAADPPPPNYSRRSARWAEVADQLRAEPGWHLIGEQLPRSYVGKIQRADLRSFAPAGAFEALARNTRGYRADIYVRYVG